ncbi:MAG: DNA topoisomerase [Clostridia bacterium]|nr:DNA topoisomerase [Clostridia bacterium]
MKLIIAEKPMLARAIAAAIPGNATNKDGYAIKGDYTIISAFGHLLTLKEPEDYDYKYKQWSLSTLPIYFDNWGKKPGEGKEERLNLIGSLLQNADCVIHAGDPDDEGQYLIDEILEWFNYQGPVYRLATGDTTEGALKHALENLNDNKEFVNSGWSAHARSVADIMVGYNFSRYFSLSNAHVKMLTVGRVQTPTLGLVVTRDLLIENHEKQGYFTIYPSLNVDGKNIKTKYEAAKDDPNLEEGKITDADYAQEIAKSLEGASLNNIKISRKDISEQPPLPFNLVKLQTYCSNKFGYDPSKTLEITQSLRDNHNAITYNRSDCQYLSKESAGTIRQVLENLKEDPAGNVFSRLPIDTSLHSNAFNDKNITAHTAIIPQNRRFDIKKLSEEERNVYLAIAKYFIAQFLQPAKKQRTTLESVIDDASLKASSTKVLSAGYLQLIKPEKKKDDEDEESESELSLIEPGNYSGSCTKVDVEAKETKAPPRYTKASLNEDMTRIAKYVTDPKAKALLLAKDKEKKGENGSIGTSATRASIIDNLEARGFIKCKGKQIQSTVLGRELYRILPDELKKPDMTGYWWAVQEEIQDGEVPWTTLTDSVLEMVNKVIKTKYPKVDAYHVPENMRRGKLLLGQCPRCGSDIIEGERGYGCSNFKNGCRFTVWKTTESGMMSKIEVTADMVHTLLSGKWVDEMRSDENGELKPTGKKRTENTIYSKKLYSEAKGKRYPGLIYLTDDGPESKFGASFALQEIVNEPPKPLGKCPRCGSDVIEGKFAYGCSGYKDGCKFVIWKKAKSGMMSKTKVTKGLVKKLLKSNWIDEERDGQLTGRKRTETEVHIKRLYSEAKDKKYTGDVYLTDEGNESQYGASFGLARFTNDGPEVLGKCPRCGEDVIEYDNMYGCTGFKHGCKFAIWKSQKQKFLADVSFTKTDAKRFLAGKTTKKSRLLDKKGQKFSAEILMDERADNPFGPAFRVVEGTIEVKDADPSIIKIDTVPLPSAEN